MESTSSPFLGSSSLFLPTPFSASRLDFVLSGSKTPKGSLTLSYPLLHDFLDFKEAETKYKIAVNSLEEVAGSIYHLGLKKRSLRALFSIDEYTYNKGIRLVPKVADILFCAPLITDVTSYRDILYFLEILGVANGNDLFRDCIWNGNYGSRRFITSNHLSTKGEIQKGLSLNLISLDDNRDRNEDVFPFLFLLSFESLHPLKNLNGVIGHLLFANELKKRGKYDLALLSIVALSKNKPEYYRIYNSFGKNNKGNEANHFVASLLSILTKTMREETKVLLEKANFDTDPHLASLSKGPKAFFALLSELYHYSLVSEGVSYEDISKAGSYSERTCRREASALLKEGLIALSKDGKKKLLRPTIFMDGAAYEEEIESRTDGAA